MHRMTQSKSAPVLLAAIALAIIAHGGIQRAGAQPPSVMQANIDYDASGFVAPAGMVHPSMYQGGMSPNQGGVMPVGFFGGGASSCGCDGGGCDGGCDGGYSGYSGGGCGLNCGGSRCGLLGCGGVLGKLSGEGSACGGCGMQGCPACGGMSNLRHCCLFCRGEGCSFCQMFGKGYLLGALHSLKPFGTCCQQRWYDVSLEAMFLSHSNGSLNGILTTEGAAPLPPGSPVPGNQIRLLLGDANGGDDLEAGARVSAAIIWGPGGNLEATYIGGQQWSSNASATDPAGQLFSFISDFGRLPIGGFDDTDRSVVQSVSNTSDFHSGELNYRRRTVGPYCRFQGSWLVGLRYVRYNDRLVYDTFGDTTRFFSSNDKLKNNLFGPQLGFDLWWNVCPGINFGMGMKGAWVQNDVKRSTTLFANSIGPLGTPDQVTVDSGDRFGTVMGDFELKLVYRCSHSWAARVSYYALAVDKAAFGTTDLATIDGFINNNPITDPTLLRESLVVQGVSFGAEYTW